MPRFELLAAASYEEVIKKSTFIAYAQPVQTPEQALAFFQQASHADARHNCWAYKIDDQQYRFNDDGEPGGTAGRPILQAIEGQDLVQVAVLVVRYFGGIKLGTGGLVRAYGGVTAKCLQQAPKQEQIATTTVYCEAVYASMERIKATLVQAGARVVDETFTDKGVQWQLILPQALEETVHQHYINLTRGQGKWFKPELL